MRRQTPARSGTATTKLWPAFVLLAIAALIVVSQLWEPIRNIQPAVIPDMNAAVEIYDRQDEKVMTVYGERDQQPVKLDEISPWLRRAIIAAEDRAFYVHPGVDPLAVCRAALANLRAGHVVQGASTLTQQLVKNVYFLGRPRSLGQKLTESLMALDMERRYGKDTILEAYLNTVYFGHGAYGAARAAQYYFGKDPKHLGLAESAYLAALVTAPAYLSLPENREKALARQGEILHKMIKLRYATESEAQAARSQRLVFVRDPQPFPPYPFYTAEVLRQARALVGPSQVFKKKLRIYTYLDPDAQELAERVLSAGIARAPRGITQGALVSISVADGGVIALVGGVGDYRLNQFNRAVSPHTAGSAFKPFVYLAGLASGVVTPYTMLVDEQFTTRDRWGQVYSPKNFDGRYLGLMTVRKALALSRNTCAVKVCLEVGPEKVARSAQLAGITSRLDPFPSLALGSSAVSPLEMASAYATLARGGVYLPPALIRRVEGEGGSVLYENRPQPVRVFEEEPVYQLIDLLQDVVEYGTGTRAQLPLRPVAGKTGTSDQSKDVWFIGFTHDVTTAVWGGNDENKAVSGRHVTGGAVMASLWRDYMHGYYRDHPTPVVAFVPPAEPLLAEEESGSALIGLTRALIDDIDEGAGRIIHGVIAGAFDEDERDGAQAHHDGGEYDWHDGGGKKEKKKKRGIIKKIFGWLADL